MNQAVLSSLIGLSLLGCADGGQQVPTMELAEARKISAALKPADRKGDAAAYRKLLALVDGLPDGLMEAVNTATDKRVAGQKAMLVAVEQGFEEAVRGLVEGEAWLFEYPNFEELNSASVLEGSGSGLMKELAKIKVASQLLNTYADVVEEGGNPELAARACLTNRQLSQKVLEASQMLFTQLVGSAVGAIAERSTREMVLRGSWSAADIKSLQGNGAVKFGAAKGLAAAIRGEWWHYSVPTIARMEFPDRSPGIGSPFAGVDEEITAFMEQNALPFDRKATLEAGSKYLMLAVKELEKNPMDTKASDDVLAELVGAVPDEEADEMAMLKWCKYTPNSVGLMTLSKILSAFEQERRAAVRNEVSRGLTEVVLAARRGMVETGRLPGSYGELKKFGLPGDVSDPYSGKGFGYDAARGVAWSVGPDGRDDGGKDAIERFGGGTKDLVVRLK